MIYGYYKKARDAAWQCLIDFNISELPVKPTRIAIKAGLMVIKNSDVHELAPHESGISIVEDNCWYIIYDDENIKQRCRFTIAHELGHILLGHELVPRHNALTFDNKPAIEHEANIFASRILMPACVLWALDLHSSEEIADICNVSNEAARVRAQRMEVLYKRNKFLTSPLEREVYNNFKEYIYKNKNDIC